MTTEITNPDSPDTVTATDLTLTRRAWINAGPGDLYDLISDVSRIGDWSPNADAVHYDQDAGPWVGAWFSGRNRKGGKEWTTRSQIVAAEPGQRFAFTVAARRTELSDGSGYSPPREPEQRCGSPGECSATTRCWVAPARKSTPCATSWPTAPNPH